MIRRLGYTILILLGSAISVCARAQCTIPAGSSSSTIQTAIDSAAKNTCAGPVTNEALFSAGTYNIPWTTQLGIPCPTSAGVIVTGPTTTYDQPGVLNAWAARPTATLSNTSTGESPQLFVTAANCTNPITITYLEVNGNRPTSGGGAVFISNNGGGPSTPTSNLTIEFNWFHGNQEITPVLVPGGGAVVGYGDTNATEVWLEGFDGGSANNGTFDTNITIDHNIFGNANLSNPSAGDCGNVMTFTGLCTATNPSQFNPPNCTSSTPGGCDTCVFSGYDSSGGECAALGVHTNTSNLHFDFNKLLQEEQGTKWYEAGSGGASSPFSLFFQINDTMSNNDIGLFHRIATEDQQSSVTDATVPAATPCSTTLPNGACMQRLNNDVHDNFDAAFGTWGFSLPNIGFHNEVGNVMISNDGAGPADFEFWGFGTGNNNLDQGSNACAFSWGFTSSEMTIKNNIFQMANGGGCSTTFAINNEEGLPVSDQPAISGNTNATTVSQLTSASPSMSPAGGTFTGRVTVTLTDNGNTSGVGPQGNTGIWCTPDGTNPVPKTGSAV
jgi:hypothetical protein